jgi:outer membrane lipoprotein-sorting protein
MIKNLFLIFTSLFVSFSANAISDKTFTLKDVEQYMSSLKSFSAQFEQIVPGEDFSKGKLYVKKPGKFLWEYSLPDKVKIVSNGGLVYFVDEDAGQTTQVPNSGLLFSILSKENVKLNTKTLKLVSLEQDNKRIDIALNANIEDQDVPISLIIKKVSDTKLELLKIISRNQLDQMVVISLFNQNNNAIINDNIFKVEIENEF